MVGVLVWLIFRILIIYRKRINGRFYVGTAYYAVQCGGVIADFYTENGYEQHSQGLGTFVFLFCGVKL